MEETHPAVEVVACHVCGVVIEDVYEASYDPDAKLWTCPRCHDREVNPPSTARVTAWRAKNPVRAQAYMIASRHKFAVKDVERLLLTPPACVLCGVPDGKMEYLADLDNQPHRICMACNAVVRRLREVPPDLHAVIRERLVRPSGG